MTIHSLGTILNLTLTIDFRGGVMQLSDVLVHVSDKTSDDEKGHLVNQLRELNGVIAPRFTEGREHLLLVSYNSDAITALSLLNEVQQNGYHARLVGM